jgi:hypothetical protein
MPVEAMKALLGQAQQGARQLGRWGRDMHAELSALPQTLAKLREGADNFQRVGQKLSDATESLDQVSRMQAGAVKAVRDHIGAGPGADRVAGAFGDVNETLSALARLNPFSPRVPPSTRD